MCGQWSGLLSAWQLVLDRVKVIPFIGSNGCLVDCRTEGLLHARSLLIIPPNHVTKQCESTLTNALNILLAYWMHIYMCALCLRNVLLQSTVT